MNLNDAKLLAELYIEQYLAKQDGGRWHFVWSNHMTTYGMCRYGPKEIVLSKPMTEACNEAEVEDTILHEIAHALTPGSGHGPVWKMMARKLGADPYSQKAMEKESKEKMAENYKWVMVLKDGDGKILKGYYRKPNASTFASLVGRYIRGRKAETLGRLMIIPASEYKRMKK